MRLGLPASRCTYRDVMQWGGEDVVRKLYIYIHVYMEEEEEEEGGGHEGSLKPQAFARSFGLGDVWSRRWRG